MYPCESFLRCIPGRKPLRPNIANYQHVILLRSPIYFDSRTLQANPSQRQITTPSYLSKQRQIKGAKS
jgi:hypothetical protein